MDHPVLVPGVGQGLGDLPRDVQGVGIEQAFAVRAPERYAHGFGSSLDGGNRPIAIIPVLEREARVVSISDS